MADAELSWYCAIKVQSLCRRFLVRQRLLKEARNRYEKIFDPKRKRYYYYDSVTDKSTWIKPVQLLDKDLDVAPTYIPEQAALKIQRMIRLHLAKLKVRTMYQEILTTGLDPASGYPYFQNSRSGLTMWALPLFMNGKMNYARKPAKDPKFLKKVFPKPVGDDEDDEDEEDESESDEESAEDSEGLSEDSETIREKRRQKRKYPRY